MRMRATALVAYLLLSPLPASADDLTYRNDRFGTQVTFPVEAFAALAAGPANGDGQTFLSRDGASLVVSGASAPRDAPVADLLALRERVRREGGGTVTYSATGTDWFVLSGYEGDAVYYERHEVGREAVIHSLVLRYPESVRERYDPLVKPIADSLEGP